MKVLLIQPPTTVPDRQIRSLEPYLAVGLGYLASVLGNEGHYVRVLDALTEGWEIRGRLNGDWVEVGLPEEEIAAQIRRFQPQMVGFSLPFAAQIPRLRSLARWVKAIHPEIFVICGGPYPSGHPEEVLAIPDVDLVVLGEGEKVLVDLIQTLESGRRLERQAGVAFRQHQGSLCITPAQTYCQTVDELPYPAYDLLPLKKFFKISGRRRLPLWTARGCDRKCAFCGSQQVFGTSLRRFSPAYLIQHMRYLAEFYGVREFLFDNDSLMADPQWLCQFAEDLIAANLHIQWAARGGAEFAQLDDSLVQTLRKSGGRELYFQIASGSRRVLHKVLNRQVDLYQVEQNIDRALAGGFKVIGHFLLGTPGEKIEEIYETLNFAWKLRSRGVSEFHFGLNETHSWPAEPFRAGSEGSSLLSSAAPTEAWVAQQQIQPIPVEIVKIWDTAVREFNNRGLVVELTRLVAPSRRPDDRIEDRFFASLAPRAGEVARRRRLILSEPARAENNPQQ